VVAAGLEAIAAVGGKNASLGELLRDLGSAGVRVPGGFATTARAYTTFLNANQLREPLGQLLCGLDGNDLAALQAAGQAARSLVLAARLPHELEQAILQAYRVLGAATQGTGWAHGGADGGAGASGPIAVAVRSSATAEDLPEASFAGQQETFLNVLGEAELLAACRRCYASLFTDRAISYRILHGFDHLEVALSIGVQRMVRADLAAAGVMFSIDTETGFRDAVLLTAAYGLGETVVQGSVNPDEYLIFKPTLEQGFAPILSRRLGSKAIRMVYGSGAAHPAGGTGVGPGASPLAAQVAANQLPGLDAAAKPLPNPHPSSQSQPAWGGPAQIQPGLTDPAQADPARRDAALSEPGQTEPTQTEQAKTQSAQTQSVQAQSAQTQSVQKESVQTQSHQTEPGPSVPAQTAPDEALGLSHTCTVAVDPAERARFAISDAEALQLARWACRIEAHYSARRGQPTPMDIEWAKDGLSGELFILQARPETVESRRSAHVLRSWHLEPHQAPVITRGRAIGASICTGRARIIHDPAAMARFQKGDLLVTDRTDPDWEPILKLASGVITNQGGRTCHAAIIAREMGITAIVGTGDATAAIADGEAITACCAEGDEGKVYRGTLVFRMEEQPLSDLPATRTRILINVGNPDEAFNLAAIPCDGVGLARLEFLIANQIKVHPMALLAPERLSAPGDRQAIAELTAGYARPSEYYVDRLAQGMGRIAAAFYPRPVVLRFSDFKSNEYARLLGGRDFEPQEENPMLGWRGASRYTAPGFREAFGLECQALKRVRDRMGLTNAKAMVPFCRTPEEGDRVLAEMARHGLVRGENGLEVLVMCELPSNVIGAAAFAERFDGFSIGSNDLTQLTLGLDRDSALVADLFDERHPVVKEMVRLAIQTAQRCGRPIGICGQAPSDYPDFARFLVEQGIDSISLNPDVAIATRLAIAQIEAELAAQG
jgi:phosphoenolpyruvate synthase